MAQKPTGSDSGSRKLLLIGLVCFFLAIAWTAYELLRPESEDEKKNRLETEKIEKEKERRNAPKPGG